MPDTTLPADAHKPTDPAQLILEAWSLGVMVGAVVIMAGITLANMRRGVLLHKLILIELLLAFPDGFAIFVNPPAYGWYLSSTSTCVIVSWSLHNVIAWMKSKPFLKPRTSQIYIGTVIMAQAYWVLEIYANFAYFNRVNERLFPKTRPYEALCRDPWWIFTTLNLFWNIKYSYGFQVFELMWVNPRFFIMMSSMCVSILFIVVDVLAVTPVIDMGGLNPFWKLAFVFKCFTDTIVLDDFKTALDKISDYKLKQLRTAERNRVSNAPTTYKPPPPAGGDRPETIFLEHKANAIHVETELRFMSLDEGQSGTPSMRSGCESTEGREASNARSRTYEAECFV